METKIMFDPQTALEKVVVKWIKQSPPEEREVLLKDLCENGCQSGMVSNLIYYHDTCAFYKKHEMEINKLLKETLSETGLSSPVEIFGEKWNEEDPLALENMNQNLLAWFGFEETARKLANRAGLEL